MKMFRWIWPVFLLFACESHVQPIPRPYGFPRIDLNDKSIRRDTLYCSKERLPTVLSMAGLVSEVKEGEIEQLRQCFEKWQEEEIRSGRIVPHNSCNWEWLDRHEEIEGMVWGFPDSSEFRYSYGDLNLDHKVDQMVTFVPWQCGGGNASMWTEIEVISVSKGEGYDTKPYIGNGMFNSISGDSSGFRWLDSLGTGIIYGTHFIFFEHDGHCCPSVSNAAIYEWPSLKTLYEEDPLP